METASFEKTDTVVNLPLLAPDAAQPLVKQPGTVQRPSRARPKARRGYGVIVSALLFIVVPTCLAAFYYFSVASNQYVTEFKFAIRGMESRGKDALAAASGVPALELTGDAFIVTDFIGSPEIVSKVSQKLDVRAIFSNDAYDWFARLPAQATVEDTNLYWKKMVHPHFDFLTGIVGVTVRAFTADDALNLSQAIIAESEDMFFRISERGRSDSVRFADQELERAETNLNRVRDQLRDFRQRERLLDPNRTAGATTDLTSRMKEELTRMNAELSTVSSFLPQSAPQIVMLKNRVRATEEQLRKLDGANSAAGDPGSGKPGALPGVLAKYESLGSEVVILEKSYAAALEGSQRARAMADRKTAYLATFVEPTRADAALYPERAKNVFIAFAIALTAWLLGLLIVSSVRDHLL